MHVKVDIHGTYSHKSAYADHYERPFEATETDSDEDSGGPKPHPRQHPRQRKISAAAVIANALNGIAKAPTNPAAVIAQSVQRQSAAETTSSGSFWDIWLSHRDYLRAHALRFSGGNLSDAEDAMSDAMLKAANAFAKTTIHNQRGWLLRLVHNACMDHHRSHRRQHRLANDIGHTDAQSAPAVAIQPDRSPEELLVAMQEIGDLSRALDLLPKFLAEPFFLHLDECSDAEIADNLNVTKEVVRKRRQMARAMLKRRIGF